MKFNFHLTRKKMCAKGNFEKLGTIILNKKNGKRYFNITI